MRKKYNKQIKNVGNKPPYKNWYNAKKNSKK